MWMTCSIQATTPTEGLNRKPHSTAATAGAQKDSLPLLVMDDRILRGPAPSREAILAFLKGEEPSSAPPPSAVPVLSVDEAVDLEDLPPGQSREIRITVRNTGEAALLLGKAQPEDGCEVVSMPQSPLAPGGTAAIGLRLTSPGQDGAFTRILRLPSNASGPPATIAVRGRTVSAMASASPSGTD